LGLSYGIVLSLGGRHAVLGASCNTSYSAGCDAVFRSRSAVFLALTWIILITAYMLKDLRRSMFAPTPGSQPGSQSGSQPGPQTARRLWCHIYRANRLLFCFVALGFVLSVFPVAVPVLNVDWFKQAAITTELAGVFGAFLFYVLGVEMWKLLKRSRGWL